MQRLRLAGDGTFNDNQAEVIAEMRRAAEAARDGALVAVAPFAGSFAPGKLPPPASDLEHEARLILSAMDAGRADGYAPLRHPAAGSGRRGERAAYRVRASLALACDAPDAEPRTLFTRDATPDAVGFVSPARLPLGYGGTLTLAGPDGQVVSAAALLTRCRACVGGWFEGALQFTRRQDAFAADRR